jgi:hypothetical protein
MALGKKMYPYLIDDDVEYAKTVLADPNTYYPCAKSYEVVGFFFLQGEKDADNATHSAHYETNLVHFIKAVCKDFNAPNEKFAFGTMGESRKGFAAPRRHVKGAPPAVPMSFIASPLLRPRLPRHRFPG